MKNEMLCNYQQQYKTYRRVPVGRLCGEENFIIHIKQNAVLCSVLFCIFALNNVVFAQYNLVNNYSFEVYAQCPKVLNAPPPQYWYLATNSGPVYANSCDTSIYCSVPNNYIKNKNFQYAHTGNAYIFLDYFNGGGRGYLQSKLKDSLKHNKSYQIEFFINIPNSLKFACNNVALLLTNTAVYVDTLTTPYGVLPANPQVYNYGNPVLGDTLNWTKVSAIYKAQGGEQFITLGNFRNDANTTLKQIQPTGYYGAGYIIDDVSVIPLDSMCLKADAGNNITIQQGDSAFIGSYTNGVDSLMWLENGIIKKDSTRPGFYLHPSSTTFYVLQQTVNGCYSSDTVYVNVLLPLKFLSYNLIPSLRGVVSNEAKQSVQNLWQTANEINVSHFNIQRSVNGRDFVNVGQVKANNKNYNEYSYVDNSPPVEGSGVVYYRIEIVDKDGKKQYSTIKQITIKSQTPNNVFVFPNPAKDVVNIVGDNIQQIIISTIEGKKVLSSTLKKVNIESLVKCIYIISIFSTNGNIKNEKLIIE